jgi:antitoxin Phd
MTKIAQKRRGAMVSPQGSKGRVLIIEDEMPLLESYSRSLSASGFDVVEASRASEGLDRLKSSNFDVILTDVLMPGIEGLDIVEQLRSRFPDIPVIAMFGEVDNRVAIRATELGVVQYLIKPIAAEALEATASHAIRMNRMRRGRSRRVNKAGKQTREASSVTATEAKNEFGKILESALRGNRVFITKHEAPKAVLISVDDFDVLTASARTDLDTLSSEFDALLARMQTRGSRSKMKAAFSASPKQLGKAAVEAASKRG